MPGQTVSLTFTVDHSSSSSSALQDNINTLRVNDLVEIIDGDHFSCGFHNATNIASAKVNKVQVDTSTQ